jgi:hypothetical protein
MKEDIIILENAIKYSQKQFEEIGEYTYLDKDKMQAIENLIKRNKELEEENAEMKALFEIQSSIAKELDFDTPNKMTRFKNTYYVPDTMEITNNIGEPKRLTLSYVDVSKFLGKEDK